MTAGQLTVEEVDALDADCAAVLRDTGAEIYFTDAWRSVWWAHYGPSWAPSRKPITLIVRDGATPVAVLPFFKERFFPGVTLARLAGVDPNFAVVTLPIKPGLEAPVLEAAIAHLTERAGVDLISIAPLSERSTALEPLRALLAANDALTPYRDRTERQHTLMDLPETSEAFIAALSKSRRREYRRDVKRLTEDAALETRSTTAETVGAAMDRFVAQHQALWEAQGKGGHFGDWPVAERFYRALLDRLAPTQEAGLDEIWHGETLISSQLRYRFGPKAYWWLNSRSNDPNYAKIGLGRVSLVERIAGLTEARVSVVDAGAGEYEYKVAYGGTLVPVHELLIGRTKAAIKIKVLIAWADLLHLVYYRAWFLKLAPRLKAKPRPLWRAWIRSRF